MTTGGIILFEQLDGILKSSQSLIGSCQIVPCPIGPGTIRVILKSSPGQPIRSGIISTIVIRKQSQPVTGVLFCRVVDGDFIGRSLLVQNPLGRPHARVGLESDCVAVTIDNLIEPFATGIFLDFLLALEVQYACFVKTGTPGKRLERKGFKSAGTFLQVELIPQGAKWQLPKPHVRNFPTCLNCFRLQGRIGR